MLKPYSPEWQAEREYRVEHRLLVDLMDEWAKRGLSWPAIR
jgi:hypothetical protein